jgi:hypothetical protein
MKKAFTMGLALLGTCALWAAACSSRSPSSHADDAPAGGIQLGLDVLSGGVALSQATYTIDGPNGYHRAVLVSLGNSPKLSTFIGGTPPGRGYVLDVTGIASDGVSVCGGTSAPFDVVAFKTTLVSLILRCQEPDPTGSIQTNGSVNYCAAIDMLTANPNAAAVGQSLALDSGSHDKDMGPSVLGYAWSASSGSLAGTSLPNPVFTCTAPGPVSITLHVSDGDCGDSRSIEVTCTGPGIVAPAPDAGPALSTPDAGTPPDTAGADVAAPADPCLVCEATSFEPACMVNFNLCVSLPGKAEEGPSAGSPRSDLCVGLYACVHATRCDAGGTLRDCFCGRNPDDQVCLTNPTGACRSAFYAAAETTDNETVLARLHNRTLALGVGATLIEECEEKPAPACGPACGH